MQGQPIIGRLNVRGCLSGKGLVIKIVMQIGQHSRFGLHPVDHVCARWLWVGCGSRRSASTIQQRRLSNIGQHASGMAETSGR